MADALKDVDPAVVDSAAKRKTHRAPVAQGVKQAPAFPVSIVTVEQKEDAEEFEGVNYETHAVVKTVDDKHVAVPRDAKIPTLVLGADKDIVTFDFSAGTIAAINHWIEKYGKDGATSSKLPTVATHIDFNTLLNNEWDKYFFNEVLLTNHQTETEALIGSINAAEKFGMEGLLNFTIIALSCVIRGKGDTEVLHAFNQPDTVKDEIDEAAINAAYPWIKQAVVPK